MRLFWLETSNNLKQENISGGCSRSGVDRWVDGCYNVTNVSSFVHPLVVWKLKFSLDRGDPRIKGTERNSTKHQPRYQTKVNPKLDLFKMPKNCCGFWSTRILLYFPLSVRSSVCHRRDISTFIANITLQRGGIWNLAQTPLKNFKTH